MQYILSFLLFCSWLGGNNAYAQDEQWRLVHQGNRAFKEQEYRTAESYYNKALRLDTTNMRARFNLGNVYMTRECETANGNPDSAAVACYKTVCESEESSRFKALAYHNTGVVYQRQALELGERDPQQTALRAAIEAYKEALRNDPDSHSSRYNLALCQKQLKKSPPSSQQQNQDKQEQQQKKEQDKKEEQQQQQEQQKKEQEQKKQEQQAANQSLINYARQAEKKTREKLQGAGGRGGLEKNW